MFLGYYELDRNEPYFNIYYKNASGYRQWHKDTFSPHIENIDMLDLSIQGNNYAERKNHAEELAKRWQLDFSGLSWSYSELVVIQDYFYKIGKRYGLLKEFKENCIC